MQVVYTDDEIQHCNEDAAGNTEWGGKGIAVEYHTYILKVHVPYMPIHVLT